MVFQFSGPHKDLTWNLARLKWIPSGQISSRRHTPSPQQSPAISGLVKYNLARFHVLGVLLLLSFNLLGGEKTIVWVVTIPTFYHRTTPPEVEQRVQNPEKKLPGPKKEAQSSSKPPFSGVNSLFNFGDDINKKDNIITRTKMVMMMVMMMMMMMLVMMMMMMMVIDSNAHNHEL